MYDLELSAKGVTVKLNGVFVGKDLLVCLTGGEAHIGAVAVAVPRLSLNQNGQTSADATVMTAGGHKEDLLARKIALALASKLNVKVCVSAGMHWDAPTPSQIEAAQELSMRLTKTLLMHIVKDRRDKADPKTEAAPKAPPPVAPKAPAEAQRPAAKQVVMGKPITPLNRPQTDKPAVGRAMPGRAIPGAKPAARPVRPANGASGEIIVDDTDSADTAGARQLSRDAQGRPVSVRQAVNATLKKPLLKK